MPNTADVPQPTRRAARGRWAAARVAAGLLAEFTGFALLFFTMCFVVRGHLVVHIESDECHAGGIARDVLTHGIRFPLLAYGQTEYDNNSLLAGVLAAGSFSLVGENVLALKLVVLLFSAAGAVATLWLLRGCLEELGLNTRWLRWTATSTLLVAIALAPPPMVVLSVYEIFSHSSCAVLNTILLAVFSRTVRYDSLARRAGFWALAGFTFFLIKGTLLVLPVLVTAEVLLDRRSRRRRAAATVGFLAGAFPEFLVVTQRHAAGWGSLMIRIQENARRIPHAFLEDLSTLAQHRAELLAFWALALVTGVALFVRSLRSNTWHGMPAHGRPTCAPAVPPVTLGLVVAVALVHLAVLFVMAMGGPFDAYLSYGYPTLIVLSSVLVAWICTLVAARWKRIPRAWIGAAAVALTLLLYRTDDLAWNLTTVRALFHDRVGASCSWRLAWGFEREFDHGLAPPGRTREQHAIERCRSLVADQRLDCIGGIAREVVNRTRTVPRELPAGLTLLERRAYAYHAGVHQSGDLTPCIALQDAELRTVCTSAAQLECLVRTEVMQHYLFDYTPGRPHCVIRQPPAGGFWAAKWAELQARPVEDAASPPPGASLPPPGRCAALVEGCY